MLKKICGLFLGLVVLVGSACVTPTHASSASLPTVIITHVMPGSIASAREESIVLYNTTQNDVDITGWCLTNKSGVSFFCFSDTQQSTGFILPAYSYGVIVSEDVHHTAVDGVLYPNTYAVLNQSSGSIVASSDLIALLDSDGEVRDDAHWSSPISGNRFWTRSLLSGYPYAYAMNDGYVSSAPRDIPQDGAVEYDLLPVPEPESPSDPPVDPEVPGDSPQEPTEPAVPGVPSAPDSQNPDDEEEPVEQGTVDDEQLPLLPLTITELLPNPDGSDTNNEFIEAYNPNEVEIALSTYSIRVGPNLERTYALPDILIPPLGYVAIYNRDVPFTLVNSSSSVQLHNQNGAVGEVISYTNPPSGKSWLFDSSGWAYGTPTPGLENIVAGIVVTREMVKNVSTSKELTPCKEGQYRNPETNRCRNSAASATILTPCASNQYRSPETNRCRNNTAASSGSLTPCKEGQVRNPETNRCRNSVAMTDASDKVLGVTTQDEAIDWYVWLGVAGVIFGILGYAIWEWRAELRRFLLMLRTRIRHGNR